MAEGVSSRSLLVMAAPPPVPELQASPRILHTALFAGALFMAPLTVFLRLIAPIIDAPAAIPAFRIVALSMLAVQLIVVRWRRDRIVPLEPDGDEAAWWNAHLGSALLIWALGESLAFLGSVFFFIAGDALMLVPVGAGLLVLFLSRPTRLMAHS
jgi:hypothetical protein